MTTGLEKALGLAGGQTGLANIVGLTPQAIQKWVANGCLPRTEWTGETNYAEQIVQSLDFRITKEELLHRPERLKSTA
jgi:hypothetical protein